LRPSEGDHGRYRIGLGKRKVFFDYFLVVFVSFLTLYPETMLGSDAVNRGLENELEMNDS
jgi:hypothetical protein